MLALFLRHLTRSRTVSVLRYESEMELLSTMRESNLLQRILVSEGQGRSQTSGTNLAAKKECIVRPRLR